MVWRNLGLNLDLLDHWQTLYPQGQCARQSQFESCQKWYLIPSCWTLSNIRYVSRVKRSNPGKGIAPSPTPRCSSYWKGNLLVALDYGCQLYFILLSKICTTTCSNFLWARLIVLISSCLKKLIRFLFSCFLFCLVLFFFVFAFFAVGWTLFLFFLTFFFFLFSTNLSSFGYSIPLFYFIFLSFFLSIFYISQHSYHMFTDSFILSFSSFLTSLIHLPILLSSVCLSFSFFNY